MVKARRSAIAVWVAIIWAVSGFIPARAEMLSTQQLLSHEARAEKEAQARAFLDREDVRQQLQAMGVDPAAAKARVAALTDPELEQASQAIEQAPAAGFVEGFFIALGVIFVLLLILELLGVTHIFRRF